MVISKEGQNEGVDQLIAVMYKNHKIEFDQKEILSKCVIPMPVDAKRNMMNASSNYEIIAAILGAVYEDKKTRIHVPGFDGNIGGYPVWIDGSDGKIKAYIDEENFDYMDSLNRIQKMSLDKVLSNLDNLDFSNVCVTKILPNDSI